MIAPQASIGIDAGPGHDAIRANQLIEAGLWLRLGGDSEGAQRLFKRALAHDPSNLRARECLAKGSAAPAAGNPSPAVRPVSVAPPQPTLEVSVVLLDEASEGAASASQEGGITADVLAFLAEQLQAQEAAGNEEVVEESFEDAFGEAFEAPRQAAPAPVPTPIRALTPVRALTPAPMPQVVDPRQELTRLLQGVEDLLALGDPSSALELVRKAETLVPGDPRLGSARERCVRAQQAALEAKLGDMKRVPVLKLGIAELMRLPLDPRAGFLLSRIDGRLSYEALFSVSGMSRQDTLRVLAQLLDQGVIAVHGA